MKFKPDSFVVAILTVILLAWFFPQWGLPQSGIPLDRIGSTGVSLIFFFYGLRLSPDKLKAGLSNWHLHLIVQLSTFLLFPMLVLLLYPFMQSAGHAGIWLALLFLAALPSTVSSSVVMVSVAKGNLPAAIFNASISGLIGIAVTPLWMGLFMQQQTGHYDLSSIYTQLLLEILLPVVLGVLLQRFGGQLAIRYHRQLSLFDKSVILLIIYKSFAESFAGDLYAQVAWLDFALIAVVVLALFYGVYALIGVACKRLHFSIEDQITAQFCGTKKSLVHGTVFSKILFAQAGTTGLMLLPLMLFHAFQILVISVYAARLGKRQGIQ